MIGLVWHVWLARVGLVGLVSLAGLVRKRFGQKKVGKKIFVKKRFCLEEKNCCSKNILI